MRLARSAVVALASAVLGVAAGTSHAQPAGSTFDEGQAVEVREGDHWSAATVKAREGRRYEITYADGTTEWVGTDRIRTPGSGDETAPTTAPAASRPTQRQFAVGTEVEVKWGSSWWKGVVSERKGLWHRITYHDAGKTMEWVEPWRIRGLEDSNYDIDWTGSNGRLRTPRDNPPTPQPGPAPAAKPQPGGNGANPAARADPFVAKPVDWPVTAVTGTAREIDAAETPWAFTPAGPAEKLALRPLPLRPPPNNAQRVAFAGLRVNGQAGLLLESADTNREQTTAACVMDLNANRVVFQGNFPIHSLPVDVSPDAKRVVAIATGFFSGTRARVDVWDTPAAPGVDAQPTQLVSFYPYGNRRLDRDTDVTGAWLIANDRVLTVNTTGKLATFKIDKNAVTAEWVCQLPDALGVNGGNVAISPDGKTLACSAGRRLTMIDLESGKILGTCPTSGQIDSLSFRADGKRLVGLVRTTLYVIDAEAGKQLAAMALPAPMMLADNLPRAPGPGGTPVPVPTSFNSSGVRWLTDDLVCLMNNGIVFDVTTHIIHGIYRLPAPQGVTTAQDHLVASIQQPGMAARTLSAWDLTSMVPPGDTHDPLPAPLQPVATGPGTQFAIDMNALQADDETKRAIFAGLRRQLAAMGWEEAPDAQIRIVGRTEDGRSEQRTYVSRGIGAPFGGEQTNVTVTEKITRINIEIGGVSVWELRTSNMAGMSVSRTEGQSVQEAVDAAARVNADYLLHNLPLPDTLFQPMDALPADVPIYDLWPTGARPAALNNGTNNAGNERTR